MCERRAHTTECKETHNTRRVDTDADTSACERAYSIEYSVACLLDNTLCVGWGGVEVGWGKAGGVTLHLIS